MLLSLALQCNLDKHSEGGSMSTNQVRLPSVRFSRLQQLAKFLLNHFGYKIVRIPSLASELDSEPPILHSQPLSALVLSRTMGATAFSCPIEQIVMLNGFGFKRVSWHPFSAALQEHAEDKVSAFDDSVLRRFYALWQPRDAAEAIAGFIHAPNVLRAAPPHGYHFSPWSTLSLGETIAQIESYYRSDYIEHNCPDLRLEIDGFKFHGPVSPELGRVELDRLVRIYKTLAGFGYDRFRGDINVYMLRRGSEIRFVCRGGVHRLAAMKALGHASIPAQLRPPYLVDIQESDHWPQVVCGQWDAESARRYFDYLFDFNALAWAQVRGLAQVEVDTTQAHVPCGNRIEPE